MPRWVDVICEECGFLETRAQEVSMFEDVSPAAEACPQCTNASLRELPPLVSLKIEKLLPSRRRGARSLLNHDKTPLPQEVRELLAKELFDPCSCGDHAPADLDSHEDDCHVHHHSFMKSSENAAKDSGKA